MFSYNNKRNKFNGGVIMTKLTNESMHMIVNAIKNLKFPTTGDIKHNQNVTSYKKQGAVGLEKSLREYFCSFNFFYQLDEFVEKCIIKRLGTANSTSTYFSCLNCNVIQNFFVKKNIENMISQTLNSDLLAMKNLFYQQNDICRWWNEFKKTCNERENCINCSAICVNCLIDSYKLLNIYNFEGNIVLWYRENSCFIASDNRKIRPLLLRNPIFHNRLIDNTEYIINEVVKRNFERNNINNNNKIDVVYKPHIIFSRQKLLEKILSIEMEYVSADDYSDFTKNKKNNLISKLALDKNYNIQCMVTSVKNEYTRYMSLKSEDILNYIRLIKALFQISDGKKEIIDDLAMMYASIFLGRELAKEYNYSNMTVLITNNKRFVEEFIQSSLLYYFVLRFDLSYVEGSKNKMPIEKYLSSKESGVSSYSIKELNDENNIGKFLEDKINGTFVNINSDCNVTGDLKQFLKIMKGEAVSGTNKYLGKQTFKTNSHYIFIDYPDSKLQGIGYKYKIIRLSQEIPKSQLFGVNWHRLTDREKIFLFTEFAEYGLKLLIENKNNSRLPEYECQVGNHSNLNYPKLFIDNCCNKIELEDNATSNEKNATAMKTLTCAYKLFFFTLTNQETNDEWNKEFFEINNIDCKIESSKKCASIIKRDLNNGYKEDEVLKATSGGNHCLGLVVKSKKEIVEIAKEIKENCVNNQYTKYSLEEFIEFFNDIKNSNSNTMFNQPPVKRKMLGRDSFK